MRPFNTDGGWQAVEKAVQIGPLPMAISTVAFGLQTGFEFSREQAHCAAELLCRSTRDPAPERRRLVGAWESSRKQGVPGLGSHRWDLDQYRFNPDFTYVHTYRGVSGIQAASSNSVHLVAGPALTSSKASGVYLVGIQDDGCELCLCSVNSASALLKRFEFTSAGNLYMDGAIFRKLC
jgi:hypothetical protein